jgi:type IV pilus assembly protein PilW
MFCQRRKAPETMKPCNGTCRASSACLLPSGFTLVELLIALLIGIIAIGAVYMVYIAQQKEYRGQQLRVSMQQNLRGAMAVLEQQIRMAGFDPEESGRFGITDVRRYSLSDSRPDPDGEPALFYSMDLDENGAPDARGSRNFNGDPRNREFANFRVLDDKKIGRRYLAWDNGNGRRELAENITSIGFAYAVDADGDGQRDVWDGGPFAVWAVDADNDNLLDTHLDSNNDGFIDERDDTDGDGRITAADGCAIKPPIGLDKIRAVRIWLLAVSAYPVKGHVEQRGVAVGDRIFPPDERGFVRRLLETVVDCRNL